jgi:hypothetical protein
MADDVYKNYFIPKDTLVIANVWYVLSRGPCETEPPRCYRKFLHDPNVYKDPFTFNPDRFLGPNPPPDPTDIGVFGYGRR